MQVPPTLRGGIADMIPMRTNLSVLMACVLLLVLGAINPASGQSAKPGLPEVGHWAHTGGPSTGALDILIDPVDPNAVYAATAGDYVLKSTDAGLTWTAIHQGLSDVDVLSLAIDPTDDLVLYAGSTNGVFKSTNGASTWVRTSVGISDYTLIKSLAIDPTAPSTIYAGAAGWESLYKSTDGAATWTLSDMGIPNGNAGTDVLALAVDPSDPATVYAGTDDEVSDGSGVYKSTDGGGNWKSIGPSRLRDFEIHALTIDPGRTDTVYAGAADPSFAQKAGVFKTTDGGTTWNRVKRGENVYALALDPNHPRILYAGTETGMAKSTDQGRHWRDANQGISGMPVLAVDLDPLRLGIAVAGTTTAIFRTTNGGSLWIASTNTLGGTVRAASGDPIDTNTVYVGTENDGLFKTIDAGRHWTLTNADLDLYYGQTLAVDPTNPQVLYAAPRWSGIRKSTDGGATWVPADQGISDIVLFSLAIDPASPETIYAGAFESIYKSVDQGESWVQYSIGLAGAGDIRALIVDPTNSLTVYAGGFDPGGGSGGDGVFKSTDGGMTWVRSSEGIGQSNDTAVNAIVIDPTSPTTLYAAASCEPYEECSGVGHVYKSTDGASHWVISLYTGAERFTTLASDPLSASTLYAAEEFGRVFRTRDGGTTWQPIEDGLTESVYSLTISASGVPYAGTGDGVFKFID
jgi:photosystem II stability/assembly factor-like uncharacterized protein